jgi:hypothetical protein
MRERLGARQILQQVRFVVPGLPAQGATRPAQPVAAVTGLQNQQWQKDQQECREHSAGNMPAGNRRVVMNGYSTHTSHDTLPPAPLRPFRYQSAPA